MENARIYHFHAVTTGNKARFAWPSQRFGDFSVNQKSLRSLLTICFEPSGNKHGSNLGVFGLGQTWRASASTHKHIQTHMCAGTTEGQDRVQNTSPSSSLRIAEHCWNGALKLLLDAFLKQGANYFPSASYSWSALAWSQGRGSNECVWQQERCLQAGCRCKC